MLETRLSTCLLIRLEHRLFLEGHPLKDATDLTILVRVCILQLSGDDGHLVRMTEVHLTLFGVLV